MLGDIDLGIVVLYRDLELLTDTHLQQLGTPAQALTFADTGAGVALGNLTTQLDTDLRHHRYAGALAYVLGTRLNGAVGGLDTELNHLGTLLLRRFPGVVDPESAETHLRDAITRLHSQPIITADVITSLESAFADALSVDLHGDGTMTMNGPAAEMATMLSELTQLLDHCEARTGTAHIGDQAVEVTYVQFEQCTAAPFDRCRDGVDPRRWPTYNPSFFKSVKVLTGATNATGWTGVVKEEVGPIFSGSALVTNLSITYIEQPGLAVTAYDLAPDSPAYPADDGRVSVDFGMVAVYDEGVHRRFRAIKVVRIDDFPIDHQWVCPLWAHQTVMSGWAI